MVYVVVAADVVITNKPAISLEFEDEFAVLFAGVSEGVAVITHEVGVAISIWVQLEPVLVI